MKNLTFLLLSVLIFFSCSSKLHERDAKFSYENNKLISCGNALIGNIKQHKINKDTMQVSIGLGAMSFFIIDGQKNYSDLLKRINDAIKTKTPVHVYIYQNTNVIADIQEAPDDVKKRYEKYKKATLSTLRTTKIDPYNL